MQHNSHGASSSASFLTIWQEYELLGDALKDLNEWLEEQRRHEIGEVQLSFAPIRCKWLVLVTQNLVDRVIPF